MFIIVIVAYTVKDQESLPMVNTLHITLYTRSIYELNSKASISNIFQFFFNLTSRCVCIYQIIPDKNIYIFKTFYF